MNRLIYAASENDADMLYATRFLAPDAFLYFEKAGRSHVALSQLEFDRGRKEARVDCVINQSELVRDMRKQGKRVDTSSWIVEVLRRHRIGSAQVASSFPVGLADALRKKGIRLVVARDGLFPERVCKKAEELKSIRHALKVTAELLGHGIETIRASRPARNGVLMLGGSPLTSERVQSVIRMEASRRGFDASRPIVAGGAQGCDPHDRGHGKLRANELIILDIFPRDLATGYWGDMTRTVVKGRAGEVQRKLFETVRQGQKLAFARLRAGVDGKSIHEAVEGFFREKGYKTGNESGRYEGFFHGTGHGLGLEIHESPRVSTVSHKLKRGHVVTVEPGLYYLKTGGVRIEDVVVIGRGGCEVLSHFPVQLEV